LLAKVGRVDDKQHPSIGFRREYDRESESVVFYAKRVPELRDEWGLLLGETIHNYRCALDHLWWALAAKKLNREPDKEARDIQFPIFDRPQTWKGHKFLKHVNPRAATTVKAFQLFSGRDELSRLAFLSNRDKHRLVQPTFYIPSVAAFVTPPPSAYIDCAPHADPFAFIHSVTLTTVSPKLDDETLRISVTPTGPNPDLDYEPYLAGSIVVGDNRWEIRETLTGIRETVTEILSGCQKFL